MLPDYNKYLPFFENEDATLEEKKNDIDRLWSFMTYMADLAFNNPEEFKKLAELAKDKK